MILKGVEFGEVKVNDLLLGGAGGVLQPKGGLYICGRGIPLNGGSISGRAVSGSVLLRGGLAALASGHFVPRLARRGILFLGGLLGLAPTAGFIRLSLMLRLFLLGGTAPVLGGRLLLGRFLRALVHTLWLGGRSPPARQPPALFGCVRR